MSIKPIETIYKGYKFRSRLEARWAVFFETLGIPWEYEKEGFDIDGLWYLPDFYLRDIDTWIEIKPGDPEEYPNCDIYEKLCEYDWDDLPLKNFVIIVGEPWTNLYDEFPLSKEWGYNGYVWGDFNYRFCECPKCGKIGIEFNGRAARICRDKCFSPPEDKMYNTHSPRLLKAYTVARQARFEHGAKP